jgi:hypothetical protein
VIRRGGEGSACSAPPPVLDARNAATPEIWAALQKRILDDLAAKVARYGAAPPLKISDELAKRLGR